MKRLLWASVILWMPLIVSAEILAEYQDIESIAEAEVRLGRVPLVSDLLRYDVVVSQPEEGGPIYISVMGDDSPEPEPVIVTCDWEGTTWNQANGLLGALITLVTEEPLLSQADAIAKKQRSIANNLFNNSEEVRTELQALKDCIAKVKP